MKLSFSQQIKKRIENDRNSFWTSFYDLSSIVSNGIKRAKGTDNSKMVSKEAVEQILNYYGAKIVKLPENITDENEQLEYLLKPTGIMRRRIELKDKWWKQTTGPLLGCTVNGSVVALMPRLLSGYSYFDPDTGKTIIINNKTAKFIQTEGFCFYNPLPAKKLNILDLLLYMKKSVLKSDVIYILGSSLLVTLLGMLLPFINKQIFNNIIPSGTKSDIFPMAELLLGIAVATTLFNVTKRIIVIRFGNKINLSVQSAAMNRILSLKASFFKDYSSGELTTRISGIEQLCSILSGTVITSGLSVMFSLAYIFQMNNYAPALVAPGMVTILVMLGFTILSGFLQNTVTKKVMKVSAKNSGLVYQLFSGVQKIKLAGAEKRAFSKWALSYKDQAKLTYAPPVFLRIESAVITAISMGGSLLLYYFADKTKVSVSNYIAFNSAYSGVSSAILGLASVVTTLANIKPLMEMVEPILKSVPELDENKIIPWNMSGCIEISNVTFSYTKGGPTILNNINLKVEPGEYVGIVGKTGCGKSTLIRLILGFESPEEGSVYFDGMDLESLDVRSVRQNIGVVMQNGKLFSGDIYSNIIISSPWLTTEEAWDAACLAGLEEDIKAMPMGMQTMIGEGCGGISGGQRQRIMIARAIAPKPKIILFDEATSALDNITQKIVSDSLERLKSTRIVVAHRLSTIKNCDRIIVIDKGEIKENGTFDELINRGGLFYELASRQIV
jgi:NHLM bacteriocin system ABC transporter ATP-binding protein